jgi:hypothetical protein
VECAGQAVRPSLCAFSLAVCRRTSFCSRIETRFFIAESDGFATLRKSQDFNPQRLARTAALQFGSNIAPSTDGFDRGSRGWATRSAHCWASQQWHAGGALRQRLA